MKQNCVATKVAIIAMVSFASPSLTCAVEFTPEDAATLQAAQQAINDDKPNDAVQPLLDLQDKYPTAGEIPRLLTHAYFDLGQHDFARKSAVDAIKTGQLTSDVLARMAQIDDQRDDQIALLNVVRLLTVIEPDSLSWRTTYGDLLLATGATSQSVAVFEKLVKQNPDSHRLHARLGNAQLKSQLLKDAIVSLETAWHMGSTQSKLPLAIAGAWSQLGDDRQAASWLERANSSNPDPKVSLQLAHKLVEVGENDRAELLLKQLVESPTAEIKADAHLILGTLSMAGDDQTTAASHFQQAVELGKDSLKLRKLLGAYHYNRSEHAEAIKHLAAVARLDESDEASHGFLIRSLIAKGDKADAREQLGRYVERHGLSENAKKLVSTWNATE